MSKLSHVDMNAAIVFICTKENRRKEDAWKHKGKQYYTIRLPYQQVKETDDVQTRQAGCSVFAGDCRISFNGSSAM